VRPLDLLKVAVVVVGLALWAYGFRADIPIYRWVGVAFVAAAFLLRFLGPRPPRRQRRWTRPGSPTDEKTEEPPER
jgi:hypothetical protein